MYESQFEDIVRSQAASLFPEYITMPFKFVVESEEGTAKADLALIDKSYLGWWVVEVEMSRHSLRHHVLPQVKILSEATYGEDVARYFFYKQSRLDFKKLTDMMKGIQPRVLVVVDLPKPDWIPKLEKHDALLALFQIFKSSTNQMIYRVNGQYPFNFESGRSLCYFERLISNFLIVESPALLDIQNDEKIEVTYNNALTEWKRLDIKDRVYLIPVKFNPLNISYKYMLLRETSGRYFLQQV
jgi:hypothetical protein